MAIGFARIEFVKRSAGKTACQKSAYNGRCRIEFNGNKYMDPKVYDWSGKESPVYHEVLLPEHAERNLKNPETLWNLVERTEGRKNSQVALELVVALPDDEAIKVEDREQLIKSFVNQHFVQKGLGAQIDIHSPDLKFEYSEKVDDLVKQEHNWHAHVLLTTRRFKENGKEFEDHKPRHLMPQVRLGRVVEGERWGRLWTQHQNRYFEEKGLELRVDPNGLVAQEHLGPVRMRGRAYDLLQEHHRRLTLNELESENPAKILRAITTHSSTFSRADVDSFLNKHVMTDSLSEVRDNFWRQSELVPLLDKKTGQAIDRYTASFVIEEESRIMRLADRVSKRSALLSASGSHFLSNLNGEQKQAFLQLTSGNRLGLLEGHAGTGKSYLLSALKDAYEANGYTVRAFAPDNATTKVLEEKGFSCAENVYRFLFALHHDRRSISNGKEVWIIDEVGKLGNVPMLEILREAERRKIQLILSGCSAQLPSVGRGGVFASLCEKHGAAQLDDIQRQRIEEQRQLARKLAHGDVGAALDRIATTGQLRWSSNKCQALEDLVCKWSADRSAFAGSSSLIIAHSNNEVRVLNELVRIVKRERGELQEEEFACETNNGTIYLSVGDCIEFRKNDRDLGVTNGLSGRLISAKEDQFVVAVEDGGDKRRVSFNPKKYHSYQLGYATTYYRSQGRTVDRAYVLHSPQMTKEAFYVGLTRHVERAYLFISERDASSLSDLKSQLRRSAIMPTSLAYTTHSELDEVKKREVRECSIKEMTEDGSFTQRVRGYSLSLMDGILSKGKALRQRLVDRKKGGEFYQVKDDDTLPNVRVKAINQQSSHRMDDLSQIDKGAIARSAVRPTREPEPLEERTPDIRRPVDLAHKKQFDEYIEKSDQARVLRTIVISESEGRDTEQRNASHFGEWQKACGERNAAAYRLKERVGSDQIKSYFGPRFSQMVCDQAERHDARPQKEDRFHEKLQQNVESVLYRLFPDGPTNRDSRSLRFGNKGSLSVRLHGDKAGCFYDFERQEGGNLFQLIQRETGLNPKEAREWANSSIGDTYMPIPASFKVSQPGISESQWIAQKPIGAAPCFSDVAGKNLSSKYHEAARYAYRDPDGNVLFYTLRLEDKSGDKIVLPLSYGKWKNQEGKPIWQLKGYASNQRPLYNQHLLKEQPNTKVLIVEGEKTADAASKLRDDGKYVVVTWQGGAGAVSKTDWSALFMRNVVIWPDNDQAGFGAAQRVCEELQRVGASSIRLVDRCQLEEGLPPKWDLADSLPVGVSPKWRNHVIDSAIERTCDPRKVLTLTRAYGLKIDTENAGNLRLANLIVWGIRSGSDFDLEDPKVLEGVISKAASLISVCPESVDEQGGLLKDVLASRLFLSKANKELVQMSEGLQGEAPFGDPGKPSDTHTLREKACWDLSR